MDGRGKIPPHVAFLDRAATITGSVAIELSYLLFDI
jgi:hypothetical protein